MRPFTRKIPRPCIPWCGPKRTTGESSCAGERLLLRLSEGGVWKVRTMDCKGEVCREEALAAEEGILALETPESGLISMEKIG